jgi:hypothetical protein
LLGNKGSLAEERSPGWRWTRLAIWCAPGLVVLIAVGGLSFWLLHDHAYFHVTAVRVYGTERVPQQELMDLAQVQRGVSLWRIDTERVRSRLLRHPWIRDVLVHRLFPNELELIIYERKPSAIVTTHGGYIVDGEGYILGQLGPKESSSLPRLITSADHAWAPGQRVTDAGVVAGLRLLAQSQEQTFFRDIGLSHIEVINPERFILHTRRGRLVVGGNLATVEEKFAFLSVVEDALRSGVQRIDAIDLTFANQIVVKTTTRTPHGIGRLQKRGSGSGQAH